MSKINIFGLGGLQENGKNLYCVEVDQRIFILDAGNKYPTSALYGIDVIIPDISYLNKNKDRIEGIFLTHGHETHIGSVFQILKELKLNVYATKFTLALLKDNLEENKVSYDEKQLITINHKTRLTFQTARVSFFITSHNIPDCVGINIDTPDGLIIYTGNYTFDQNYEVDYLSMFKSLTYFGQKGVLALLSESKGSQDDQNRGTRLQMKLALEKIFNDAPGRMLFTIFSSNIARIQMIINLAHDFNKKIAIIGRKTQRIVKIAIEMGYLKIPEDFFVNLKYIDDKNKNKQNNDPNLVCLVTGERHEPYYMLKRMAEGKDRLLRLEPTDTIITLTKPYLGTEKLAASSLDAVYKNTSNVLDLNQSLLPGSSASREEIKEMINIIKPKYIVPVIGEYRQFYGMREIADCLGYKEDRVIIMDNGDVCSFENKKFIGAKESVPVGEVFLDGHELKDVNDFVMRDRELLAEDGFVMIVANIITKTKKIVKGPEIINKGINIDEELNAKLVASFNKTSQKHLNGKYINWGEYKKDIRDSISRDIYKMAKQSPIIIPVIIGI